MTDRDIESLSEMGSVVMHLGRVTFSVQVGFSCCSQGLSKNCGGVQKGCLVLASALVNLLTTTTSLHKTTHCFPITISLVISPSILLSSLYISALIRPSISLFSPSEINPRKRGDHSLTPSQLFTPSSCPPVCDLLLDSCPTLSARTLNALPAPLPFPTRFVGGKHDHNSHSDPSSIIFVLPTCSFLQVQFLRLSNTQTAACKLLPPQTLVQRLFERDSSSTLSITSPRRLCAIPCISIGTLQIQAAA